jgi:hypothetical protein
VEGRDGPKESKANSNPKSPSDRGGLRMKHITINLRLHRLMRSRFALSTVVTTLIILVISVLLASVVTYFAINIVSTRVQEESLALTKQHVWYSSAGGFDDLSNPTSATQATLMIINTGGRDVVVQKFSIRGQTVAWGNVYYATTQATVSDDLDCQPYAPIINDFVLSDSDGALSFTKAGDSLTLKSGWSMVLYINQPDSITINDVGLTVSITLNTAQAMYYVEANVQAYVPSAKYEPDFTIRMAKAWYSAADGHDPAFSQCAFVITNNMADATTITSIYLPGADGLGTDWYAYSGDLDAIDLDSIVASHNPGAFEPVPGHNLEPVAAADGITIAAGEGAVVYFTAGDLSAKLGGKVLLGITHTVFETVLPMGLALVAVSAPQFAE